MRNVKNIVMPALCLAAAMGITKGANVKEVTPSSKTRSLTMRY